MNVHELTFDQIIELKQAYLTKLDEEGTLNYVLYNDPCDETGLTYDELANADSLVPDEIVFNEYADDEFVPEDFSVANPDVLTIEVSNIIWDIEDVGRPYTSKDFGLPSGVVIQMSKAKYEDMVEDGEDIQEAMADYISDRLANEYDFCVTNFTWRFIHINPTTQGGTTMKTIKTKKAKTAKKTTKVKTKTKPEKIPFASWLESNEGYKFRINCETFRDVDDGITEAEIQCFGTDGWVTNWIEHGDHDCFPFVDPKLKSCDAFGVLYSSITNHSEDAAIILTYGTNYSDDRENFAYDCLKAIAGEEDAPSFH